MARSVGKSRNAIQIIDASIADIEAGLWVCGELVGEETPGKKPMGCALGLIGINSGAASITVEKDALSGETVCMAYMDYPAEAETSKDKWTAAAKKAVAALADTTRLRAARRKELAADSVGWEKLYDPALIFQTNAITAYNDGGPQDAIQSSNLSKKAALAWFQRAREALVNG